MARGHIRKRGNGYAVVIELPKDPGTGKRRQKWLSASTKREAERLLTRTLHEVESSAYIKPSTTPLGDFLTSWLTNHAQTIEGSTLYSYRSIMRLHIIPELGHIPLNKVSPFDVQHFYDDRAAAGLSASRIRQIHTVLHQALDQAVRWQLVLRNACDGTIVPTPARGEHGTWWDIQAADVFLARTAADEDAALWRIALHTGMRQGELIGLRWQDIDLDARILTVQQTMKRTADGSKVTGYPKTSHSRRAIPLRRSDVAPVRDHRRRQLERRLALGAAWQDHGLVFDSGDGGYCVDSTMYRHFVRATARAGLPRIRFHDLRHSAFSNMLQQGMSLFDVSRIAGHSSIAITADLYGHVTVDNLREAIDRLDMAAGRE